MKITRQDNITVYDFKNQIISNNFLFNTIIKKNFSKKIIYISGGSSLNILLKKLKKINSKLFSNFFLTDERLTKDLTKTNIYNIKKKLHKNFIKFDYLSIKNIRSLINYCNKKLPVANLIVFGIGNDGHIASIFKGNYSKKKFFISKKNNESFKRISISEKFILRADEIIFFINNKKKNIYIKLILSQNNNVSNVPFLKICKKFKKKIRIFTYQLN